mgnify:CR=1 FL=1
MAVNIIRTSAITLVAAVTLSACVGTQLEKAKMAEGAKTPFNFNLVEGYIGLASMEYKEGDYEDSDRFATRAMAAAGADLIVCHMGLTTGGAIGAQTAKSLDDCVALIDAWTTAALETRDDAIILCHGGPISEPEDAEYVLRNCKHVNGFYGASSMERVPTEIALTEQTRNFKNLSF